MGTFVSGGLASSGKHRDAITWVTLAAFGVGAIATGVNRLDELVVTPAAPISHGIKSLPGGDDMLAVGPRNPRSCGRRVVMLAHQKWLTA